ncbi:tRNA(his) guanylyltransferase-related [Anaeramoeba ignava]|uniref:tRNA(His) guanylyltransferase n=1 Tax=Anaeramoeba ignava TaxID=1746090 RepID=A0A9Q0RH49_ANAIG|nr:tRNA(his) guanylyltransferase-related [Anaeramoeba ignava]|eukprot:Anaeramoba_ignava/c30439_g1_i1.p1 GENE.c30439_g1_i1~~c30439_g1_i1.p1  ORF type:complete len:263 (-),score=89.63 c30439_g1_i1:83-871(-)
MANTQFQYVKKFEQDDSLLLNTWLVVRIDGRSFHKFSQIHSFEKPNDKRAIGLMNQAAKQIMEEFGDVIIAYGQSDEYSFVLHKSTTLYSRRASKILSTFVSLFTGYYIYNWKNFFPDQELKEIPSFDSRIICYPSKKNIRDYLSWRQADCHINSLYNTCFWCLVKSGISEKEATEQLRGTFSNDKNELLFSKFGINYNDLPQINRKGTVLYRKIEEIETIRNDTNQKSISKKKKIIMDHIDIISEKFWKENPILTEKRRIK